MSKLINVLIVVDTDAIKQSNSRPSNDPARPTRIARHFAYMIASGTTIHGGQGTSDLSFRALVGDTVLVFATSSSGNCRDIVLLSGLSSVNKAEVLCRFEYCAVTRSAVAPRKGSTKLAVHNVDVCFYENSTNRTGTEDLQVEFALYVRDDMGEPELFGYYSWNPTITVN